LHDCWSDLRRLVPHPGLWTFLLEKERQRKEENPVHIQVVFKERRTRGSGAKCFSTNRILWVRLVGVSKNGAVRAQKKRKERGVNDRKGSFYRAVRRPSIHPMYFKLYYQRRGGGNGDVNKRNGWVKKRGEDGKAAEQQQRTPRAVVFYSTHKFGVLGGNPKNSLGWPFSDKRREEGKKGEVKQRQQARRAVTLPLPINCRTAKGRIS